MRSIRLLPVLCLTLLPATLAAQQPQRTSPVDPTRTILTFTVVSSLVPGGQAGRPQVPVAILERAAQEANLANLSVEKPETRADARLRLTFVFENEAEFRRWYAGEQARGLFDLLARHGHVEHYNLDVKRFPLAQYLPRTN